MNVDGFIYYAIVAQLVEYLSARQNVESPSLSCRTNLEEMDFSLHTCNLISGCPSNYFGSEALAG